MEYRRQSENFHFEEDFFSKDVPSISKIHLEVLLLMKFLQTKPQIKSLKKKYYDL